MPKTFHLALAVGCLCIASNPGLSKAGPTTPTAVAPTKVTPEIRAALERMADALKAQQSFELKADVTEEEVLDDGEKIQSSSTLLASVRRPDRLYVDVLSRRHDREFYYNGKTLTLYGPVNKYYASVAAPPTTVEMLDDLANRYGLQVPLFDLFEWGTSRMNLDKVTSSMYAGSDTIAGKICDQYVFRQPDVDWQIWIPRADPALPCKLVITNTADSSEPATSAVLSWTSNAQLSDSRFNFAPPQGAYPIALSELKIPSKRKGRTK